MKLSLKNIGKIRNATVELNGITVIAGENNSGKSTVGKVLYSVFNSFYNIEKQIQKERIESVRNVIDILYVDFMGDEFSFEESERMAEKVVNSVREYCRDKMQLEKAIIAEVLECDEEFEGFLNDERFCQYISQITDFLLVSDEEIISNILDERLKSEFNEQVNNIYTQGVGEICLQIKEQKINVLVLDDDVQSVDNKIVLRTEAIYIDDPFVLDDIKASNRFTHLMGDNNHRIHLKNKLYARKDKNMLEGIVASNKIEKIYNMINFVCDGEMVRSSRIGWEYRTKNSDKALNVKNLSTGLKTFVILKRLLVNGVLEMNGTIILDEPEIHLHPEWQLVFAELIVLLQKEFGMHILLNTHSPYFLNAIEVYAAKHEIADKCKYYMTEEVEECSDIVDVTNNIEAIYAKLARPLQRLENERYMND